MSVRDATAAFEDLIKSLTGVADKFNITKVEVQYFIDMLSKAGEEGMSEFMNNTKSTLDVMFTYFNQFNNNTTQSIMDQQTLMVQLINEFRKKQKQQAIDDARELLEATRKMLADATAAALAERGPLDPGQTGNISIDANGNWVNRPGGGGGMTLGKALANTNKGRR